MNPKKLQAVMALEGGERFAYFVRKTADHALVWGLHGDGWATANDDRGALALPFWPEREFAAACAAGAWARYVARPIPLDEFLGSWLPGMARDSRMVAVFPTDRDRGVLARPDAVLEAIEQELDPYE